MTPSQKHAIESSSREILACSGAGAGKTRTLVERVAHLIRNGATPDQFLILTFTRRAAAELRERVQAATGSDMKGALCATFHSVCLHILRQHGAALGYNPETLSILDEEDADELLRMACRDRGILKGEKFKSGYSFEKVCKAREAYYSAGKIPELELVRTVARYSDLMKNMNCVDFGAMLMAVNLLFAQHAEILQSYRDRIRHVFLDEAQDQDLNTFILHDWFTKDASFFAVFDERQCIYEWRGARPELTREKHPNAEVIELSECFRCGNRIVEHANKLIAHNGPYSPLIGATGREGFVTTINGRSMDILIAAGLQHEAGYKWSDIAIMARDHRSLIRLEELAKQYGMPVNRVGKEMGITKLAEFRDVLACLRLVSNNRDDMAFVRLAGMIGMMNERFAALREAAAREGCSMFREFQVAGDSIKFPIIDAIAKIGSDTNVVETCGDLSAHFPGSFEYQRVFFFWARHCATMNVTEALEWLALRDSQDEVTKQDAVTLLTAHSAKGLEWPVVIVANMNENHFPTSRAIRGGDVAGERRLAYVAFTRARERLIVHWRKDEDQAEGGRIDKPSRFLEEAGLL